MGALEWIDDERLVPANDMNAERATYSTVHLHDNSMPLRAELPLATVLAAAEEYVRTGQRRPAWNGLPKLYELRRHRPPTAMPVRDRVPAPRNLGLRDFGVGCQLLAEVADQAEAAGRVQGFDELDRLHASGRGGVQIPLLAGLGQCVGQTGHIDQPITRK